jgi:hypothetical protein
MKLATRLRAAISVSEANRHDAAAGEGVSRL